MTVCLSVVRTSSPSSVTRFPGWGTARRGPMTPESLWRACVLADEGFRENSVWVVPALQVPPAQNNCMQKWHILAFWGGSS